MTVFNRWRNTRLFAGAVLLVVTPGATLANCPPHQNCGRPAAPQAARPMASRPTMAPAFRPNMSSAMRPNVQMSRPGGSNNAFGFNGGAPARPTFGSSRPGQNAAPANVFASRPAFAARTGFSAPSPGPASFGGGRTFGTAQGTGRTFGAQASSGTAPGAPAHRVFGQSNAGPGDNRASDEGARRFGSGQLANRENDTPRSFGAERRFGGGPSSGAAHDRGLGAAHASFSRDVRGRPYFVNGHRFAPFRTARYAWPRGYGYHRYAVGYRLPPTFIVQQYYVTDYESYGVEPPPSDFQWVRYGPDLLLVDVDSGQVQNAVYGVFEDDPSQQAAADETPVDDGSQPQN